MGFCGWERGLENWSRNIKGLLFEDWGVGACSATPLFWGLTESTQQHLFWAPLNTEATKKPQRLSRGLLIHRLLALLSEFYVMRGCALIGLTAIYRLSCYPPSITSSAMFCFTDSMLKHQAMIWSLNLVSPCRHLIKLSNSRILPPLYSYDTVILQSLNIVPFCHPILSPLALLHLTHTDYLLLPTRTMRGDSILLLPSCILNSYTQKSMPISDKVKIIQSFEIPDCVFWKHVRYTRGERSKSNCPSVFVCKPIGRKIKRCIRLNPFCFSLHALRKCHWTVGLWEAWKDRVVRWGRWSSIRPVIIEGTYCTTYSAQSDIAECASPGRKCNA